VAIEVLAAQPLRNVLVVVLLSCRYEYFQSSGVRVSLMVKVDAFLHRFRKIMIIANLHVELG
jgi:hypothetical protein